MPKAFQDEPVYTVGTKLTVPATVLFTIHYRRGRRLLVKQTLPRRAVATQHLFTVTVACRYFPGR